MKKLLIMLVVLFWGIFPITVKADMGPKPSIVIDIKDEEDCYATLLSKQDVSGPYVAYDVYGKRIFGGEIDEEIFAAFSSYEDVDGYHFMQLVWNLNEGNINWNYYPPDEFKVLLYYPQSDSYKISDSYDAYAFNSIYILDIDSMSLIQNYDYSLEILSFIVRVVLTIVVELLVALIFNLCHSKAINKIIKINIITQIILNLLLNIINYFGGSLLFMFAFIPLEVIVCIIEMIYYNKVKEIMGVSRNKVLLYALCANIISMIVGWYLARLIPGIF